MNCLFLNTPLFEESLEIENNGDVLPPLGIFYIVNNLKINNINVEVLDCVKDNIGIREIINKVNKENYDFIGLNIFTQNYEIVKKIVSSIDRNIKVLIGGQAVASLQEEILNWRVDNSIILITGEGELIIPDIIKERCCEEPKVRKENKLVYVVDKNSKYFPYDLDKIKLDRKYIARYSSNNKEACIIASRGCCYDCAFCGGAKSLNPQISIRYRSIENIRDEIFEILNVDPNITSIRVLDDLFLRNKLSIENAINLFNNFPTITWRCMVHIKTFSKIDIGLLRKLKESGCKEVFIGIESGSDKIRKQIKKLGSIEEIITTIKLILDVGINVKGYFMYGFPDEDEQDALETYNLAKKLKKISRNTLGDFRTSTFEFRPYHGTELYYKILKSGRIIDEVKTNSNLIQGTKRDYYNFTSGNYSNISDQKLIEFIRKTQDL